MDDTSPKMREAYERRMAEMTPSEKTRLAASLWAAAHQTQLAATRLLYPDADENEILYHIAVTRFGEDLARKAYRRP